MRGILVNNLKKAGAVVAATGALVALGAVPASAGELGAQHAITCGWDKGVGTPVVAVRRHG